MNSSCMKTRRRPVIASPGNMTNHWSLATPSHPMAMLEFIYLGSVESITPDSACDTLRTADMVCIRRCRHC